MCYLSCPDNYTLNGPPFQQCGGQGVWSPATLRSISCQGNKTVANQSAWQNIEVGEAKAKGVLLNPVWQITGGKWEKWCNILQKSKASKNSVAWKLGFSPDHRNDQTITVTQRQNKDNQQKSHCLTSVVKVLSERDFNWVVLFRGLKIFYKYVSVKHLTIYFFLRY